MKDQCTDREMSMYALLSNQGTAMHETALSAVEYFDNRGTRERVEREAPADAAQPLQWADVTDNEAFQPSDDEIAEWFARKYPGQSKF